MKLSISLVSGIIFSLIALLHLLRLIYGWTAQIGTYTAPMWFSILGLLLAAVLAAGNFAHCHRCK